MSKLNSAFIYPMQIAKRTIGRAALMGLVSVLCIFSSTAHAQTTVTYFHNDIAGSPMVATNSAGNVVWKASYKPYGEKVPDEFPTTNTTASNKIGYAGSPFDASTGLSYMGARYYDPQIGRFMGIDPVGFQEDNIHSFNRYAYANNNPYKFVDRDGRIALPLLLGIGALATGSAYLGFQPPEKQRALAARLQRALSNVFNSESSDAKSEPEKGSDKAVSNVRENKSKGDKAEDQVAADLANAGRDTDRQVRKDTPFGPRVIDIEVKDKDGNVLGGVEVKQGGSRYRADQRSKDAWLGQNDYPVNVIRVP